MLHITDIKGLRCNGIKEGKNGLGVVVCSGNVAGVFTQNRFKSPSIVVTERNIKGGWIEGMIVNSGNANAFTGKQGMRNAKRMCELLANELKTDVEKIAVASTGVIGIQLDMNWIESKFVEVYKDLGNSKDHAMAFAKSIMTTDRLPKIAGCEVDECKIAGVCKGAGMIHPNMATMLAFIFTNADFRSEELREMLKMAVKYSFNTISVDGDTSTNDMVLLVATGEFRVGKDKFLEGLKSVCLNLAKQIVRDGEGATKVLKVEITNARDEDQAFKGARVVVSSNLVKTAIFGCDPNWGRIVASLGYAGIEVNEELDLTLRGYRNGELIAEVKLVEDGVGLGNEGTAREVMESVDEVQFIIDLKLGSGKGYAYGCDLSYEYVRINSEYTS
ncbi:MAG: arginine biosynthesis protein ArgJ [Archaeoglobales archaeon]|nr:MAG: arginine biosynthesis protein ArgJ [Archaeoglobales archaeon]